MKENRTRISEAEFVELFPDSHLLFELFGGKTLIEKEVISTDKLDDAKEFYWITLETRFTRQYNIRINKCDDGTVYFGAWSTDRLMQPFEDWHRGNDLNDGKLSSETITRFLDRVINDLFVNAPSKEKRHVAIGVEQACPNDSSADDSYKEQ